MESKEYDRLILDRCSRMGIDAYKDEHGTYLFIKNEKMENGNVVEKTVPEGFVNLAGRYVTHAELAENHAIAVKMSKAGHVARILAGRNAVKNTVPGGFTNLSGQFITNAELAENHSMEVKMSKAGNVARILAGKYDTNKEKQDGTIKHDINDSSKWKQGNLFD